MKTICGVMGHLPPDIWALTPRDTELLIDGWNEAQAGDRVEAPTRAETEELMQRYGG